MDKYEQTFDSFKDSTNNMDSEVAKLFLEKALYDFRKGQIQKQIDESLKNQDKEEFLRLTDRLKAFYNRNHN